MNEEYTFWNEQQELCLSIKEGIKKVYVQIIVKSQKVVIYKFYATTNDRRVYFLKQELYLSIKEEIKKVYVQIAVWLAGHTDRDKETTKAHIQT
jgi:hypothetical protein